MQQGSEDLVNGSLVKEAMQKTSCAGSQDRVFRGISILAVRTGFWFWCGDHKGREFQRLLRGVGVALSKKHLQVPVISVILIEN